MGVHGMRRCPRSACRWALLVLDTPATAQKVVVLARTPLIFEGLIDVLPERAPERPVAFAEYYPVPIDQAPLWLVRGVGHTDAVALTYLGSTPTHRGRSPPASAA